MAKQQNAFLAKRDAQKEAEYKRRLQSHSEIHIMAMLIAAHNELKVGPGRAAFLLAEYMDVKMQLAKDVTDDIGDSHKKGGDGDPEFLYTRRNPAKTLKGILGPEKWKECQEFFPMLRRYWDI